MHGALLTLLVLLSMSAGAEPEIHRCTQEDGTVAFQETPCPEPAKDGDDDDESDGGASTPADDFFDFVNPFDEPEEPRALPEPAPPPPAPASSDRAECEKMTRDAIDAIDLEMRKGYTKEERGQYLAELLALTRQLRDCKRL